MEFLQTLISLPNVNIVVSSTAESWKEEEKEKPTNNSPTKKGIVGILFPFEYTHSIKMCALIILI